MTLKFSDSQFVFINVLWKITRKCMRGLFCIANLLEVSRKKKHVFLILWVLTPSNQTEEKYFHIKC